MMLQKTPPVPAGGDIIHDESLLLVFSDFALSTYEQFRLTNDLLDLESACSLQQKVLDCLPKQHAQHPSVLSNLANFMLTLFQHTGQIRHLEDAVQIHQEVFQMCPGRLGSLNNLANALERKF